MINPLGAARQIMGVLGQGKAGGAGLTTLISDTFTDTDTTVLSAHTPDVDAEGGGWGVESGTIGTIDSNTAITGGNSVREIYAIEPGTADMIIAVDILWYQNGLVSTYYNGIAFRVDGGADHLLAGFNDAAFVIAKCVGGTYTVLDSTAFSASTATWYTIEVTIDGNDLSATLDGGANVSVSDATLSGTEKVGIISYRNRMRFDNFIVQG